MHLQITGNWSRSKRTRLAGVLTSSLSLSSLSLSLSSVSPCFLSPLPPPSSLFQPSLLYTIHRVSMRREHLLEDAFRFIMGTKADRLRRKKCNITWDTEEG